MAELRAETRYARQLFLYGAGDGQPVRNVPTLSKLAGVHVETIRKHLPVWEKEAEAILAGSSELGLAVQLSSETLKAHERDMVCLRNLVEAKKFELDRCDEITAKLEGWLDKFEDEDREYALRILEAWQKNAGLRSSLESQFLALQKQWTSLAGIVDLKDISVVREKEIAKGKAKLTIKQLETEQGPQAPRIAGGVFARDRAEVQNG